MQTIGERLEEARKRKGISIREAAEATKIRGDYLQKFESNQFDLNLAEIYVRGFLRSYAQFLKLPAEKIVNDLSGLGVGSRPKAPSRELYGRMDLSVATSDDIAAAKKGSDAEETAEESPATARRMAPAFNRPMGSGMPPGPMINPNLVIKGGIALGAVVVLILIIWGITAMVGGNDTPSAAGGSTKAAANTPAVGERKARIIALGDVLIRKVEVRNPDGSAGEILLSETQLRRGESREVPWRTAFYIHATAGENLQIEVNGNRYGVNFTGDSSSWLPAPSN